MALGGGTFQLQNKVLPGAYINFVSTATASTTFGERGTITMPLELNWGVDEEVFKVENSEFQTDSMKYFGYDYIHEEMKGLRDLFQNCTTAYFYKLNSGGLKAENDFARAKYTGTRGNDITISVEADVDEEGVYNVSTYVDFIKQDTQSVYNATELTSNDWVTFKTEKALEFTLSNPLTGGENGVTTGQSHQTYLNKIEKYTFNAMGVVTTDDIIKSLYVNFTKRLRDEVGMKFQTVLYNCSADYEGVVNVVNDCIVEELIPEVEEVTPEVEEVIPEVEEVTPEEDEVIPEVGGEEDEQF